MIIISYFPPQKNRFKESFQVICLGWICPTLIRIPLRSSFVQLRQQWSLGLVPDATRHVAQLPDVHVPSAVGGAETTPASSVETPRAEEFWVRQRCYYIIYGDMYVYIYIYVIIIYHQIYIYMYVYIYIYVIVIYHQIYIYICICIYILDVCFDLLYYLLDDLWLDFLWY